jgi:hypothetical protein
MEFAVVRGETQNSILKTQNLGGRGVILPVGVGMGGKRYVAWRWVRWPLGKGGEGVEVPMGRVVGKVAEAAMNARIEN